MNEEENELKNEKIRLADEKKSKDVRRRVEISGLKILIKNVLKQQDCLYITHYKKNMYVWDGQFLYKKEGQLLKTYITLNHIYDLLDNEISDNEISELKNKNLENNQNE